MQIQIGQILDAIENPGAENDILVMLSADHGGKARWHGRFQDVDIMIPMLVKGNLLILIYRKSYIYFITRSFQFMRINLICPFIKLLNTGGSTF